MVETSWLHLRVDQREWYHYGAKTGFKSPFATDFDMHKEYAWDAEEVPLTPTKVENEISN
jgi:hypothetical protein